MAWPCRSSRHCAAIRIYASGLRNPVGLAWEPQTGVLWVSVNERDELGDHLPSDDLTATYDRAADFLSRSGNQEHKDRLLDASRRSHFLTALKSWILVSEECT